MPLPRRRAPELVLRVLRLELLLAQLLQVVLVRALGRDDLEGRVGGEQPLLLVRALPLKVVALQAAEGVELDDVEHLGTGLWLGLALGLGLGLGLELG